MGGVHDVYQAFSCKGSGTCYNVVHIVGQRHRFGDLLNCGRCICRIAGYGTQECDEKTMDFHSNDSFYI